jgi:uncharacterized membrane protein (UPF0127 family)
LLAVVVATTVVVVCRKEPVAPRETVTINGRAWHVELALTPEQQHEGLAHRASLPPDHGMLFVFEEAEPLQFYMLNCLMAIDIAFIDSDHKVIRTYTMPAEPGVPEEKLKLYPSIEPARFALEVGEGELARAGVKPGQKVEFSAGIPWTRK